MAKRGIKEWIMRSVILVVGLIIAHFGVTLFLLSNLGADPFNVFVQGLFRILSSVIPGSLITHGRTHMAVCLIIIFILLFVDRSYIKIGTVICMGCGGPIIDFFTWLLGLILGSEQPLWSRILMLVLGCVILAYGMTIVIKSDAGTGPNDLVAVVISDKTKKKFGIIRLLVDGVFATIGFALGGVLGAGTIVCIALVGPVAGVFLPINERMINKILKKDFCLQALTFENCEKAYEIDRTDIPDAFVDDVPTLIETLKFGFENKLKGHAFLITKGGRAIGTILLGQGIYCENDPEELKDKTFYRLVSFVLDKNFRGQGLGSKILESTIEKVYNDFGILPIVLGVHKDNEKAARFYLKNGFTKTSCMDGDDYCFINNP